MSSLTKRLAHRAAARSLHRLWIAGLAVSIVLLAFGLRIYAVSWGLPYTDHPDEPSAANRVLGMIRRNDWNPTFFGKPSLYYYALRLVFAAHLQYGLSSGLYTSINDIPRTTDLYLTTPGFFIWGRVLTVLLGTATVALAYGIGRRAWGAQAGLAAAAVLAVLPFHMRHSQYITQDVPSAFVALLALATALRIPGRPGWRNYALAGFAIGLAASTKYNVVLVALAVAAAHLLAWGRQSLRTCWRLLWAAGWSLIGFVLTTPYALITPGPFINGVLNQYAAYAPETASDVSRTWPWDSYAQFFWETGLHPLPLLAALLGIAVVIARRDRAGLVLLGFTLPYPLLFLPQKLHFFRNMLPIIPPLALLAGIGIIAAAAFADGQIERITAVRRPHAAPPPRPAGWRRSALAVALTCLVVIEPLQSAAGLTRFYAQPHSKVRAGAYVRDHLPHGAPIAVDLNPVQWANQPLVVPIRDVTRHTAAWYRAQGFRYLVANVTGSNEQRYRTLKQQAQLVAGFPGDDEGQPGPRMELLDLGSDPGQLAIERQHAVFGNRLRLLGFQQAAGDIRAAYSPLAGPAGIRQNQALQLNLYWQPLARLEYDYAIFLHLIDAQGQRVAQRDTVIRAADYPTSRWQPGELAVDIADLYIPPDLPSGAYQLVLGVYRMETLERLPRSDAAGTTVTLAMVQVQH